MLEIVKRSVFDIEADALVNPVNCVGVAGAGLALEFKKRYNESYRRYRLVCNNGKIKLGKVWID